MVDATANTPAPSRRRLCHAFSTTYCGPVNVCNECYANTDHELCGHNATRPRTPIAYPVNGNAFAIMGAVRTALYAEHSGAEANRRFKTYVTAATADDYVHLLDVSCGLAEFTLEAT